MVDIEFNHSFRKSNKGKNIFNQLFKRRSKRNLNEMVRCLSGDSNEKLDQLIPERTTELNNNLSSTNQTTDKYDVENSKENNLKETKFNKVNQMNRNSNIETIKDLKGCLIRESNDTRRRLSTPIIQMDNLEKKEPFKKLSLKMRRSFSPKSKLIINSNQKKMSLDYELLEHYNRLSTECNNSYMDLVSNSPISPRVQSIDEDIEAITMSRSDNPYIQAKLERLSQFTGIDYDILSISNLSLNGPPFLHNYSTNNLNQSTNSSHSTQSNQSNQSNQFSQSNKASSISSSEELDEILNFNSKSNKDDNLHQHLIRSPPLDFPKNFSSFIFPPINSPLRSLTEKYNSINSTSDTTSVKTPNFLSPLKTPRSGKLSNQSPKINRQNIFFTNLSKSKLKNLNKSNDSELSTNENDVELIITN